MAEKPIIFGAPMARAILDGAKTQTRRVIKPQPTDRIYNDGANRWYPSGVWGGKDWFAPYKVGDLLWVRETWTHESPHCTNAQCGNPDHIWYRANEGDVVADSTKWRPSIFMPRWASRITLRVTNVRVQQVQDISIADAIDEGVAEAQDAWEGMGDAIGMGPKKFIAAFAHLWDKINSKRGYGWNSNPGVWVYTFEVMRNA